MVDFCAKITSPTRIDLDAVAQMLIDLKEEYNVRFNLITADQYQSTSVLQRLKKEKVAREVKRQSVDRFLDPYYRVSAHVTQNLIKLGHSPTLHRQAKALKEMNGKQTTAIRKDMLDAFCGSMYGCINAVKDQPTYGYDMLNEQLGGVKTVTPVDTINTDSFEILG